MVDGSIEPALRHAQRRHAAIIGVIGMIINTTVHITALTGGIGVLQEHASRPTINQWSGAAIPTQLLF